MMMAMKFFQPNLRLSRALEFDIWRESNLVESYGTSREGLALAAVRRGFRVYTMGRHLRYSFVDVIHDKIPDIDYGVLELLYKDTRAKFRAMGLRNVARDVELATIRELVKKSHLPILFTSTSLFGEKKDPLPHWVIVTGCSREDWYLNNPLGRSPQARVNRKQLESNLGYRGVRCAVVVAGQKAEAGEAKGAFNAATAHAVEAKLANRHLLLAGFTRQNILQLTGVRKIGELRR